MHERTALSAAVALVAALPIACGSGDDGQSETNRIKQVFVAVHESFYAADGKGVCDGITAKLRDEVAALGSGQQTCAETFAALRRQDQKGKPGDPRSRFVRAKVKGDTAVATVSLDGERYPVPFVKQNGEWKMDGGLGIGQ